jgi:hypothetical protein
MAFVPLIIRCGPRRFKRHALAIGAMRTVGVAADAPAIAFHHHTQHKSAEIACATCARRTEWTKIGLKGVRS